MRILLTNDDGVDAPGLEILERIARELSDDIWIVAPDTDRSGSSHSLTLGHPLRVRSVRDRVWSVSGTPTDCVIMGVRHLVEEPVDLILSGVNEGQNIGNYVHYSGTVAGAIEGTLLGIRSVALSQACSFRDNEIHWETSLSHGPELLRRLLSIDFPRDTLVSINFPHCEPSMVSGFSVVGHGRYTHGLGIEEHEDSGEHWVRFLGDSPLSDSPTDISTLTDNRISVTPVRLDMSDHDFVDTLTSHFDEFGDAAD